MNESAMPEEISSKQTIQVTVNGDPRHFAVGTTIADLIASLDLQGRRVAVECNQEIVPKSAHGGTLLNNGDELEIVHAIGGG
jgi:sulfur carrier protein|nr:MULTISPECIES: sulfur carrier protein ThiS [unclassified Ketobacter]|tara:strand:+ start:2053 stop:2298 length:246 start_codon:yes stop_codon:yes gene_type:complete